MSAQSPRQRARSAIDLLEEAMVLLRAAPASALVAYYAGAVPFWLALLYFVADMGQSAFAAQRLVGGSLGVALLFIWMKCWHAVFAGQLRGVLFKAAESPWTFRRVVRVIVEQASIQPWGLIVRPVALIVTIPFIWVSAVFQNATVLGDSASSSEDRSLLSRSWQQAQLWPGQAHLVVGMLLIFGIFVWLNVMSFFYAVPWLLKTFFDIETEVSRNGGVLFNSTVLTAALALTLLFLDPIFKAVYVLRCFYGESLHTGQDLKAQLQRARKAAVALVIGAMMLGSSANSAVAAPPSAATVTAVDSGELNRSIEEVLQRREYAWRSAHREVAAAEKQQGWVFDIRKWIVDTLKRWKKQIKKFFEWLFPRRQQTGEAGESGGLPLQEMAYLFLAVALLFGLWALWKRWRQGSTPAIEAEPLPALPDLHSDDVAADQLPEDGWLELMRKLLAEGQRRLALRAAYLASLAHLGQRELLTIARHKSNRDYSRELHRRARSREALLAAFRENIEVFERAWYGEHEVSDTVLEQFTRNLETIRAC